MAALAAGLGQEAFVSLTWRQGLRGALRSRFADTPITDLVRLAKVRWRIEHDYRELKHGLALDHFEGRSWPGWHHHVTLVTAAHAFLTEQRPAPKAPAPGSPSTRSSTPSRMS